jgi:hypothetical protein
VFSSSPPRAWVVLDPVAMKQILSALVPELGFLEAFASIFS